MKHGPTGENWIVACIDTERNKLSWVGWPEGWAKLSDCVLIEKATEEERDALLTRMAAMQNTEDRRCQYAKARILENKLSPDDLKQDENMDILEDGTIIDRTYEFAKPDSEVTIILPNSFKVRFFESGLTNEEYIRRAKSIENEEKVR